MCCHYISNKNQKSGWVDMALFKERVFPKFVPGTGKFLKQNNLPYNTILVLYNMPSHLDKEDYNLGIFVTYSFPLMSQV